LLELEQGPGEGGGNPPADRDHERARPRRGPQDGTAGEAVEIDERRADRLRGADRDADQKQRDRPHAAAKRKRESLQGKERALGQLAGLIHQLQAPDAPRVLRLRDAIILEPALMLIQILDGRGNNVLRPGDVVAGGVDGVDRIVCTSHHGAPPM
jgi:hypothetical protein